ncbi:MAG: hypothetical protein AAGJ38_01050 [Planctomycetota bacterium]
MSDLTVWQAHAEDLAAWAHERLVNRDDRYGGYGATGTLTRPATGNREGVVTEQLLARHFAATNRDDVIGLHAAAPDQTARWLGLDFDDHDGEDPEPIRRAAIRCHDRLKGDGFPSIILNSNGRGGVHLWSVFADPVPLRDLHFYAQDVANESGLPVSPESNPKQPFIPAGGWGNWLRVPGRHHTREVWSRAWINGAWANAAATIDALLNLPLCDPLRLPVAPGIEPPKRSDTIANAGVWCRGRVIDIDPSLLSKSSQAGGIAITFRVDEQHDGYAWNPIQPIDVRGAVWIIKRDGTRNAPALDRMDRAFGTTNGGVDDLLAGTLDVSRWPSCQVRVERTTVFGRPTLHAVSFRAGDAPTEPELWLSKATPRGERQDRGAQLINFLKFVRFDLGHSEAAAWRWAQHWNQNHVLEPFDDERLEQTFQNAITKQYGTRRACAGAAA